MPTSPSDATEPLIYVCPGRFMNMIKSQLYQIILLTTVVYSYHDPMIDNSQAYSTRVIFDKTDRFCNKHNGNSPPVCLHHTCSSTSPIILYRQRLYRVTRYTGTVAIFSFLTVRKCMTHNLIGATVNLGCALKLRKGSKYDILSKSYH